MANHLSVVPPNAKAPKPSTPKSISDAVEKGTGRDVLAAMRKALAKKLDDGEVASNAIASAYKELRELDRLIRLTDAEHEDDLPSGDAGTAFDASAI